MAQRLRAMAGIGAVWEIFTQTHGSGKGSLVAKPSIIGTPENPPETSFPPLTFFF